MKATLISMSEASKELQETSGPVERIGFWSALLSGALSLSWGVTMVIQNIAAPPQPWAGIDAYVRVYNPIEMLNLIPSLPLASTFLVLMVCLDLRAAGEQKIWTRLGLAFSLLYAVLASINYLIQFVVVRPALLAGQTEGLALFVMGNPKSIFRALASSYPYMSIALFFAAWAFRDGKIGRWIHWIFLGIGLTTPIQFAYVFFDVGLAIGIPVILAWVVGMPAGCFLLARLFSNGKSVNKTV